MLATVSSTAAAAASIDLWIAGLYAPYDLARIRVCQYALPMSYLNPTSVGLISLSKPYSMLRALTPGAGEFQQMCVMARMPSLLLVLHSSSTKGGKHLPPPRAGAWSQPPSRPSLPFALLTHTYKSMRSEHIHTSCSPVDPSGLQRYDLRAETAEVSTHGSVRPWQCTW